MTKPASLPHTSDVLEVDLLDPEFYRGDFPHESFTLLRQKAPVAWQPIPDDFEGDHDSGFWLITNHALVQATNRDTETFSALEGPSIVKESAMTGNMLVSMDGAAHIRQRALISAGFTPRMIGRVEEQARGWASKIVDSALERGTCNFVQDIAYQLPMHMIGDILGIPVEDRDALFTLTNEFLMGSDPQHNPSPEHHQQKQIEMFQYAQALGKQKREEPGDDIWTLLTTLEIEGEDGQRTGMAEIELDFFFLLLTLAGSETTRNAISSGMVALLDNPDQLAMLRRDPEAMRPAVEEILRWTSPVSYFARRATRDTEIGGVPIAKDDRVTLWYPSANRDEEVFEDPFRFDITRKPNPHVAFGGGGAHFCLGANLARREIAILFEELLGRTREIEVLAPPSYSALGIYNPVLRAMKELLVRLS